MKEGSTEEIDVKLEQKNLKFKDLKNSCNSTEIDKVLEDSN